MKYSKIISGTFISRPNRFIAIVNINGINETVHVKNTGRCKEILIEGCKVYLYVSDNPERKTKYDLIAVEKETENGKILINIDSQIPNSAAEEWLNKGKIFSENAIIRREVKYGNSRFDFYIEDDDKKAFLEVKGVTLENNGVVSFPDAPTERGIKHLNELCKCIQDGYEAYILFVIQMKGVKHFEPSYINHPEFAAALKNAAKKGVTITAVDCIVTPDSMIIDDFVDVRLNP